MSVVIITGSGGLVGSEAARYYGTRGFEVVGIDNDMRGHFFGEEGSTAWATDQLAGELRAYRHHSVDIRDSASILRLFSEYGTDIERNAIHGSDSPENAAIEIAFFFATAELV